VWDLSGASIQVGLYEDQKAIYLIGLSAAAIPEPSTLALAPWGSPRSCVAAAPGPGSGRHRAEQAPKRGIPADSSLRRQERPMAPQVRALPREPHRDPRALPWRMSNVFNPGALYDDGRVFLYERAAGGLRPFLCTIGLLERARRRALPPRLLPARLHPRNGRQQARQRPGPPRRQDRRHLLHDLRLPPILLVLRPHRPRRARIPPARHPGVRFTPEENQTRSGIAVSRDRVHWSTCAGHAARAGRPRRDPFPRRSKAASPCCGAR